MHAKKANRPPRVCVRCRSPLSALRHDGVCGSCRTVSSYQDGIGRAAKAHVCTLASILGGLPVSQLPQVCIRLPGGG